jgi:acetyltransferase-like isoleucine patch superfamily enzyme
MSFLNNIKRFIIHTPYYIQDFFAKCKRNINIIELNDKAIIGDNFCSLKWHKTAGQNCRIYNSNKRENVVIGKNVCINGELFCNVNGHIEICHCSVVGSNSYIYADNSIKIGKYCFIARDVLIQDNNSHPLDPEQRKKEALNYQHEAIDTYLSENGPIEIADNVWIGTRAIILKNVTIGYGSIIGAGAVVTRTIPPMCIAAGNPATVVKTIDQSPIARNDNSDMRGSE